MTIKQKYACAYADWVAGVLTAETGPASFAIGAACSYGYAKYNGWAIVAPLPDPIPSTSDDQGVLHNAMLSNCFAQAYPQADYVNMINMACQVRPYVSLEIKSLSESYFNKIVNIIMCLDLSPVQNQITVLSGVIKFNAQDIATVTNTFTTLAQVTDPAIWSTTVNNLISQVANFNLSQSDKSSLTGSLQILRSSFVYWSSCS